MPEYVLGNIHPYRSFITVFGTTKQSPGPEQDYRTLLVPINRNEGYMFVNALSIASPSRFGNRRHLHYTTKAVAGQPLSFLTI
jgi:hypothetical protein